MESCSILDSDWERWGLGMNYSSSNDVFDFSSPLDQSLTSGLEDSYNNGGKSDVFEKWMDEKIDLSILDGLESQSCLLDDLDVMIEDPSALLENLMDWSSEIERANDLDLKLERNDTAKDVLSTSGFVASPDSPGSRVPDNTVALSPEYQQMSFYVKPSTPKNSFATLVETNTSDNIDHLSQYLNTEKPNSLDTSELSDNFTTPQLSPSVSVSSIETTLDSDYSEVSDKLEILLQSPKSEASLIRDSCTSDSTNFTDFNSNNNATSEESKDIRVTRSIKRSQNHKKSVSTTSSCNGEFRRERKRKQNKDAATRYRQKKRKECIAIKCEEDILESKNKELKSQVQQLSNEISYLKGLLNEAKSRMKSTKETQNKLLKGCSKIIILSTDQNKIFLSDMS